MNRTVLIFLLALIWLSSANAQSASDVIKNINNVKRDTSFIYAESTTKDLSDAYNNARAILEMQVGEWVRKQHPSEDIEVCIVKAKEHFMQFDTRRGELYRAFVYVRKSDIMPVEDKNEVAVFEVAPAVKQETPVISRAVIVTEEPPVVAVEEPRTIELTPEEKQMKSIKNFYDVEPFINGLKSKGLLKAYGKYATMPSDEDSYLFVYNRQGIISALLRKRGQTQYNLNTLKEDNVKNYKNCGAIWFQLK